MEEMFDIEKFEAKLLSIKKSELPFAAGFLLVKTGFLSSNFLPPICYFDVTFGLIRLLIVQA